MPNADIVGVPNVAGTFVMMTLVPMTTAQRDALVAPILTAGLCIFNSTTGKAQVYDGTAWGDL